MNIPLQFIRQAIYPSGRRLPTRPKLVTETEGQKTWREINEYDRRHLPSRYSSGTFSMFGSGVRESASILRRGMNLPKAAYRDWEGAQFIDSKFARCRCCGERCDSVDLRKDHLRKRNCSPLLTAAYKLMRQDGLCAICEKPTTQRKWGVPLCSSGCAGEWCAVNPPSVTRAIDRVNLEKEKRHEAIQYRSGA